MLLSLKAFLQEHRSVGLQELSLHFCKQPDIVRDLLAHWIQKGKVRRLEESFSEACGKRCQACSCRPLLNEVYVWVG